MNNDHDDYLLYTASTQWEDCLPKTKIELDQNPFAPVSDCQLVCDKSSSDDKEYHSARDRAPSGGDRDVSSDGGDEKNMKPESQPFFPRRTSEAATDATETQKSSAAEAPAAAENEMDSRFEQDREIQETLQNTLNKQIQFMKCQHQYIQNLQRANLGLKNKLKQVEELKTRDQMSVLPSENMFTQQVAPITTEDDLEPADTTIQEMEIVPIGTIEEESRRIKMQERSLKRGSGRGAPNGHYRHNFNESGKENFETQNIDMSRHGGGGRRGGRDGGRANREWPKVSDQKFHGDPQRQPFFDGNRSSSGYQRQDQSSYQRNEQPSFQGREKQSFQGREQPSFQREEQPSFQHREQPSFQHREQPSFQREEQPSYQQQKQRGRGNNGNRGPQQRQKPSHWQHRNFEDDSQNQVREQSREQDQNQNQRPQRQQQPFKSGGGGRGQRNRGAEGGQSHQSHRTVQWNQQAYDEAPPVQNEHRQRDSHSRGQAQPSGGRGRGRGGQQSSYQREDRQHSNHRTVTQVEHPAYDQLPSPPQVPKDFFKEVTLRTAEFEVQRRTPQKDYLDENEEDGKVYEAGDFIIETKNPHADKHFFVEEELLSDEDEGQSPSKQIYDFDLPADPVEEKEHEGSCNVYEVDGNGEQVSEESKSAQKELFYNMREVRPAEEEVSQPAQKLLEDFGFQASNGQRQARGAAKGPSSLDHSDIRKEIDRSIRSFDEEALSAAIDQAHDLGEDYPFQGELKEAEDRLYELTVHDNASDE